MLSPSTGPSPFSSKACRELVGVIMLSSSRISVICSSSSELGSSIPGSGVALIMTGEGKGERWLSYLRHYKEEGEMERVREKR